MGKYRPGTLDTFAVNERRRVTERRTLKSANQPTGSQVFGTTGKVRDMDTAVSKALEDAAAALAKAQDAFAAASSAQLPVGSVVQMASKTNPADAGAAGTWRFLTSFHVPMTDVTLHLFERIEDDDDI